MDDRTLRARVVQAQLGDTGALNEVLKAIQHSVLRHVSAMVGGDDRAWDVVQVTLLSIARTICGLWDPRLFKPWAFRIATRAAVKAVTRDRREELFADVWRDTVVTDDTLTRSIRELREAFGDDPRAPRYIETVPRRGFRWLGGRARGLRLQERRRAARDRGTRTD